MALRDSRPWRLVHDGYTGRREARPGCLISSRAEYKRNYVDRLEPLADKRIVFIFDECHRSQFGENHESIRTFFPNAQLFGFTGTPIFTENSTAKQITGDVQKLRTTEDLFQQPLHEYTITDAIADGNVLKFHVDYFRPEGKAIKPGETLAKKAVVEEILKKHNAATGDRKFNAILATGSINDAIAYFDLFNATQAGRAMTDPKFVPLNVTAVFSPPGDVSPEVRQMQEDLIQEAEDNKLNPEEKKIALKGIIANYNDRFGTNHRIEEFDQYYQDVQKRIKDQQYSTADFKAIDPEGKHQHKLDLTIVVDMLLTGFDSKYLNTLYVDKNLKYHQLIQAFSRTNRVLNATKPYGNILDFRGQQAAVDAAITLFSGKHGDKAREIWLVDKAPVVIDKLKAAKVDLDTFLISHGLPAQPQAVHDLKGDAALAGFVKRFKEVQKLQTQLDQYTDLTPEQEQAIEQVLPKDELKAFRGVYLDKAKELSDSRAKPGDALDKEVDQLDFEFVLFASATIDYDYIMKLIADFSQAKPGKQTMTRDELIGLIASDAKFLNERDAITEYVRSLKSGEALDQKAVERGYQAFRAEKGRKEVADLAAAHGLPPADVQAFVDRILRPPMIFDAGQLNDLLAPLALGWKARTQKELALMTDLVPLLKQRAGDREIAGLKAYEE